ncbi:ABC transporter ATP-binding protein [bacterium]|nr:ABC transporter ATP-binding protein [bacterium]
MDNLALNVQNVSISYRTVNPFRLRHFKNEIDYRKVEQFKAVNDVSFSLPKGKILGIIGKNGSGKSTLLKAIAGIFSPDSGQIDRFGNQVSLLALGVGFESSLTGWENIYLSGMLMGFSKSFIANYEEEIIDYSELGDFIYKPVESYSSGMRSRLAFSISAILDTDILLIDEVLSVGDASFRKKSNIKLQEIIHDHNTTVIIVSHNEKVMMEMCDEAIWLDHGKVIEHGNTEIVVNKYLDYVGQGKSNKES